jgi:hypothetical protein
MVSKVNSGENEIVPMPTLGDGHLESAGAGYLKL